ncbi:hypothetical protein DXG03_003334 [Asterophora parasitica]|uniref:Glycosyltransferase 2-like domain-containing protein n=1 Tax=Asterophora parasitica TaxID=117018 RepID=A0A9P7G192_9AGAR|nr:hypothetical protein DXG03_003334 [Asterophora parasitica]
MDTRRYAGALRAARCGSAFFFALQIIQNLSMILGPIEQYHANSKYYSAIKPRPLAQGGEHALPHVTIQMPVYKEGLSGVLAPSITSLKRAMQTYARQGGTSSLFVNDDGLRLLPPAARKERLEFYALHSIGWVARPPHGSLGEDEAPNGFVGSEVLDGSEDASSGGGDEEKGHKTQPTPFVRAGRFKKASNMNYALALSMKLEHHLARLIAEQKEAEKEDVEELEQAQAQGQEEGGGTSTPPPPPVPTRTRSAPNLALLGAPAPSTPHSNLNANSSGTSTPPSRDLAPSPSPSAVGPGKTPEDPSSSSSPSPSPSSSPSPSPNTKTPIPVCLEDQALALAVEETWAESVGGAHRPWAGNGRAARMGEIVLIVDSDTVVPEDCLRDAAREMGACPSVAIIQHESADVMQVAHHYFENGIAYFTRRINKCISMGTINDPPACANGEVAPFVGHNAFLRWRALQDAAFVDPADGKEKIWSESNVSEDFDMALRLMGCGYIIRWATYSEGGFKEGVSLSVDDELNRWQKYSYGCSELLFNPIIEWFRRGPFAQQIHRFMWSNAPLHYKVSMMAYMFSYYGIAASVTISVINYILLGFQFGVDGFYMHSFEIWLATTVVFFGSGTVGYSLLQYRLGQKQLVCNNLLWDW